jgi:hypothetical protein
MRRREDKEVKVEAICDIHDVHDLDAWLPEYVAEGLFYLLLALVNGKRTKHKRRREKERV